MYNAQKLKNRGRKNQHPKENTLRSNNILLSLSNTIKLWKNKNKKLPLVIGGK